MVVITQIGILRSSVVSAVQGWCGHYLPVGPSGLDHPRPVLHIDAVSKILRLCQLLLNYPSV